MLESIISTELEAAAELHKESSCPTVEVVILIFASQPSITNLLPTSALVNSTVSDGEPLAPKSATLNSFVIVMPFAVDGKVLYIAMSGAVIPSNTESVPTLPGTLVKAPQYGSISNLWLLWNPVPRLTLVRTTLLAAHIHPCA